MEKRNSKGQFMKGYVIPPEVLAKMVKARIGGKRSDATKLKMSESIRKTLSSPEVKQKMINAQMGNKKWLGKKHKSETILKMSEAQRGDKGSRWDGGKSLLHHIIRESSKYSIWRNGVFVRDNYVCKGCGAKGVYLQAHHIKSLAIILKENDITTFEQAIPCSEIWDNDNGVSLCIPCHKKTDTYGVKKFYQKISSPQDKEFDKFAPVG